MLRGGPLHNDHQYFLYQRLQSGDDRRGRPVFCTATPIRPLQAIGFAVSLSGVLCIVFKGDVYLLSRLEVNIGDLFMVASMFFWSIHTTTYKQYSPKLPPKVLFTMMMLGGVLVTVPMAAVENAVVGLDWIGRLDWTHLAGILALNIFPSVLAYLFWNKALTVIEANKVAIFQYLIPVYTTLISVIWLGERLCAYHLVGGGGDFHRPSVGYPTPKIAPWPRSGLWLHLIDEEAEIMDIDYILHGEHGYGLISS